MALLTTERLWQEVKDAGRKVTAQERREILRYVRSVNPEITNVDFANLFNVSEGMIRKDLKIIREDSAKEIGEEDVSLVVSDIIFNFKRQLRDLERSKAACKPGTTEYRLHSQAIFDLESKKVVLLQQLGIYPKNLGAVTVNNYEYAAIVVKGDAVDSRPLTMFDDKTQREVRQRAQALLPAPSDTIEGELVDSEGEEFA